MTRCLRLTLLMIGCLMTALHAGQEGVRTPTQPPTFKSEVEFVELDAIVTDGVGRFVHNLRKEDFQVFDDGTPQKISSFTLVELPIEPYEQPQFAVQSVESDVTTNKRPFDGRVYVVVIDDLHIDATRSGSVTKAVKEFIQRNLAANDVMAVVHTFGPTDASQEFTNNRRLLLAAVDRTIGRKLPSETLSRNEQYIRTKDVTKSDPNGTSGSPLDQAFDPHDVERAYQARSTLGFLEKVANWFAGMHGRRKSILFVSEGIDYNIYDIMGNGFVPFNDASNAHSASTIIIEAIRDVITAATRANVSIYGIDARGMTSLADDAITVETFADAAPHESEVGIGLPSRLGIGAASLMNEVQLSQDSLRALSEETGGFAVVNQSRFANAYQRLVDDNSSYYELAYSARIDKRDGKYHKIEVRVNQPGLKVRARKGWMVPKGKSPLPAVTADRATIALRDAANNVAPISNLRLQMFAVPLKGKAPNASVLIGVELLGGDMKLATGDKLKVLYLAVDAHDKVRSQSTTVALNFRPETRAIAEQSAVRILSRLDLPPGRYQIRYAAHESGADVVGSVRYDLEVPDFTKTPLSLSGIVLTSAVGSLIPTIGTGDERLRDTLPGLPIAGRVFSQDDEIALFVEIYDNEPSKPHKVDIVTTVLNDKGAMQFKTGETHGSADLRGGSGYRYVTRIPLKGLTPGAYVLRVAAHADLRPEVTSDRQIPLTIVQATPKVQPQ